MRAVLIISLVMSFSAFSQTRVKENIKQSSVSSEDTETEKNVKKPRRQLNSGKRVKSEKSE